MIGSHLRFSLAVGICLALLSAPAAIAAPSLTTTGPPAATGDGPQSVAFSPAGDLLAVADQEADTVSMFAVSAGGVLTRAGAATSTGDGPASVAFSPDGRLLATANVTGDSVSMFEVSADGALDEVGALPYGTGDAPISVAFSPRDRLLVTANFNGDSVAVFSVSAHGALTLVDTTRVVGAISVAFDPRGRLAVASFTTNLVTLFTLSAEGAMAPLASSARVGNGPQSVAFGRDGQLLATANFIDDTVAVFAVSGAGLTPAGAPARTGDVPYAVAFSPDGRLLATANRNGNSISTFSLAADGTPTAVGPPTPARPFPVSVAFSPDGRLLATANHNDDSASTFSVSPRGMLTPIGSPSPTGRMPMSLAFNPRGAPLLATANRGGDSVSLFSTPPSPLGALTPRGDRASGESPFGVVFDPTGTLLATANQKADSVTVFGVAPGGGLTDAGSAPTQGDSPFAVAFSPVDRLLATANAGAGSISTFTLSAAGAPTLAATPTKTDLSPVSIAFRPDGRLLATANSDPRSVWLFHVSSTGQLSRAGSIGTDPVPVSVTFSPDGKYLATANRESNSVSLFSVTQSGEIALKRSTATGLGPVAVAFSPDGRLLATANRFGNTMSLFLVDDGVLTEVGSPSPTGRGPFSVAFSPSGKLVATANNTEDSVSVFTLQAPVLDTSITSGPDAVTGSTTAAFAFEANYPSTFECRIDAGAFEPCVSGAAYSGLAEGHHTFAVRARDLVGNAAPAPAPRSWTIDLTPPLPVALAQPANHAADLPAATMFSWTPTTDATAGVARYELWIDGKHHRTLSPALCAATCSAAPLDALGDGSHSWQVRTVDEVGNESASVLRTFTVDAAPPAAFGLGSPADDAAMTDRRPVLAWQPASDAGIGLAGYDVLVDGTLVDSVGPSVTSFAPAADLGEGTHTWQVVARDSHGNRRDSAIQRFTVDLTPPAAALAAAPNPALADRIVTFDAGGSRDGGSGIARYEWDLDGDGVFERASGPTPNVTYVYGESGTYAVQVRVFDRAGLSSTARVDERVTGRPRNDPLGVSINDGARYTSSPRVVIRAIWPSFANQMLISNDGGFKDAQPFALGRDVAWALDSAGAERLPKIVYVRFVRGLTVSETYTDDIILDERDPSVLAARVTRTAGAAAPLLRLRARDRGLAGIASVQVTNDRRRPGARFRAYRTTLRLTRRKGERAVNPRRRVFVRVRDRAGNVSRWRTAARPRAR